MGEESVDGKIRVDIGVSARAELKAEIPARSMGRFVDALTDAIRPFTEARGLRADQVRLQREEVLIKIAKLAQERISFEDSVPKSVPNKFLVPFLEKASLEDDQSELVERWANLLATASSGTASDYNWCISILSDMTPGDASLLDSMYAHSKSFSNTVPFEDFTRAQMQDQFEEVVSRGGAVAGLKSLGKAVHDNFGFAWVLRGDDIPNTNEVHLNLSGLELSLSRLESLGLIWVFAQSTLVWRPPEEKDLYDERVFVIAAHLTPKGRAMVEACSPHEF